MMKNKLITLIYGLLFISVCLFSCKQTNFVFPERWGEGNGSQEVDDSLIYSKGNVKNKRKLLIIGIDGGNGNAFRKANTPNINMLIPHAIYSFDAHTKGPVANASGWSSLLTGVWMGKHGVRDDVYTDNAFLRYQPIIQYIKDIHPGYNTVSICSRSKVNKFILRNADIKISTGGSDEATKDSAIAYLTRSNSEIMLLEFDGVDRVGEQFGYDSTSSEYLQAITKVDGYVGEIMQALQTRSGISDEDWLVIIVSNYGGRFTENKGRAENTFAMFYNEGFLSKELSPTKNILKTIYFHRLHDGAMYIEDGTNPTFVKFDTMDHFTVQFVAKFPEELDEASPFITNKDWNNGSNAGWVVSVDYDGWKFNAGGSGRIDLPADGPSIGDKKWHSYATTVDKVSNILRLFQDDSLVGIMNFTNQIGNTWDVNNTNIKMTLGDDITGHNKVDWGVSKFEIANIRIYDTLLSLGDMENYSVASDTTSVSPGSPFYGHLIAWWKCTEGSGSVLKDYGPNGYDMQLLSNSPDWRRQRTDLSNEPLPPTIPEMVDIAPTILDWFDIHIKPKWQLEGVSWIPEVE